MSIEIKLTDQQFPISPVLVDFLYRFLENQSIDASWQDQHREKLSNDAHSVRDTAQANLSRVLSNPVAINTINRSYDLMMSIMFGHMDKLAVFQQCYKFMLVVGIPRSGGSYLTKHLFKSIGIDPARVSRAIAHDGFPNPMPFQMIPQYNPYTSLMRQTAEYLAMTELFFGDRQTAGSPVIVPKKITLATYHGAFFREVMGPDTECIITLRHPVAACISTYEKSGGLPKNGKFVVRSNIEDFAQRASLFSGTSQDTISSSKYFDIYLHYWETYHYNLATTGLMQPGNHTIVCYGEQTMQAAAADLYTRFSGSGADADDRFRVKRKVHKHPGWNEKANGAIQRVAAVWRASGIQFPEQQLLEAW